MKSKRLQRFWFNDNFDNLFGAIFDLPGQNYTKCPSRVHHVLEARHQHIRDFT
jgi:hypothetical protein